MPRNPNVILPQEEASVVAYLRSKLRGEARQALHQQQFTTIEQLLNRLKKAFGIVGDIFDSDAKETWHGKSRKIGKLHQQGSNRIQPNH